MDTIVTEGRGVVVYLRGHEGRGIGLVAKLQAYQLQDGGRDTVDANLDLGLPADARHYGAATQVLKDLGVRSVRLMTNNPDKVTNLEEYGITVAERVPLTPHPNDHNLAYLLTKRDRMGHRAARPRRGRAPRSPPVSGEGAAAVEPFDASGLRVAVVAASWHTVVMDGLLAGAAQGVRRPRRRAAGRPRPGHLRAPGGGLGARAAGVRRRGRPRRRDPGRHPALRLRLLGRDRRADPGRARPHRRDRLRRAHLRHRAAGARPRRPRGLAGGQGLRGDRRRAGDRSRRPRSSALPQVADQRHGLVVGAARGPGSRRGRPRPPPWPAGDAVAGDEAAGPAAGLDHPGLLEPR